MPKLKQLNCTVHWTGHSQPLAEFGTSYSDGIVSTWLAVPELPTPFYIRLKSTGYIAPGLSMFVFIDGKYQCNRNRRNLVAAKPGRPRYYTEIDFKVSEKENKDSDGSVWASKWRFAEVKIGDPVSPSQTAPFSGKYLGIIEVVVLRCRRDPEEPSESDGSSCECSDCEAENGGKGKHGQSSASPAEPPRLKLRGGGLADESDSKPKKENKNTWGWKMSGEESGVYEPKANESEKKEAAPDQPATKDTEKTKDERSKAEQKETVDKPGKADLGISQFGSNSFGGSAFSKNAGEGPFKDPKETMKHIVNDPSLLDEGDSKPAEGSGEAQIKATGESGKPVSNSNLNSHAPPSRKVRKHWEGMKKNGTEGWPSWTSDVYTITPELHGRSHTSHQVWHSNPSLTRNVEASPFDIDTVKEPYAIFEFSYRDARTLSKGMNFVIGETPQEQSARLSSLSPEELVGMFYNERVRSNITHHQRQSLHGEGQLLRSPSNKENVKRQAAAEAAKNLRAIAKDVEGGNVAAIIELLDKLAAGADSTSARPKPATPAAVDPTLGGPAQQPTPKSPGAAPYLQENKVPTPRADQLDTYTGWGDDENKNQKEDSPQLPADNPSTENTNDDAWNNDDEGNEGQQHNDGGQDKKRNDVSATNDKWNMDGDPDKSHIPGGWPDNLKENEPPKTTTSWSWNAAESSKPATGSRKENEKPKLSTRRPVPTRGRMAGIRGWVGGEQKKDQPPELGPSTTTKPDTPKPKMGWAGGSGLDMPPDKDQAHENWISGQEKGEKGEEKEKGGDDGWKAAFAGGWVSGENTEGGKDVNVLNGNANEAWEGGENTHASAKENAGESGEGQGSVHTSDPSVLKHLEGGYTKPEEPPSGCADVGW